MFDLVLHGSVQAADGDALADFVARQDERLLCGACQSCVECDKETDNERPLIEHGAVLPTKHYFLRIGDIFQSLKFKV
jgi:hypothetical protein